VTEILFGVLLAGLKLWGSKDSHKYLDEVTQLRKDWVDEYDKPEIDRDNNAIDTIELRLSIIAKSFVDTAGK
jgi:hypothetical protein